MASSELEDSTQTTQSLSLVGESDSEMKETKSIPEMPLLSWKDRARTAVEKTFWSWNQVQKFRKLRHKLIRKRPKDDWHLQEPDSVSSDILRQLMPDSLATCMKTMRAKLHPKIPNREVKWIHKKGEKIVEVQTVTDTPSLDVGHFGSIFHFLPYGKIESVIKLQRFEHVKRPLDIYSYLMEILIGLLIQNRDISCTPYILDVVKSPLGDVGMVMEKLSYNLWDFFFRGPGATDKIHGLLILIEVAHKLYILQKCFDFRHRDLRMKNIMLTSLHKTPQPQLVRIIDLGKSTILFEGKLYSAYSGDHFTHVGRDYDLGFLFADMLIQFDRHHSARKQLHIYEATLQYFCQGIRYEDLVYENHKNYLSILMHRVADRPERTKEFSNPYHVFQYLWGLLEKRGYRNEYTDEGDSKEQTIW